MKIVVGLGNPGKAYEHTRHNVGFEVLDELARRHDASFRRSWRFRARLAEIRAGDQALLLVKPQTFVNRSGEAVASLLRRKGLSASDLMVIVDDVELERGQLRIRARGSAGGHNGLKSMIERLGTEEFVRLRVGVGRVPEGVDRVEYVLARFSAEDRGPMEETIRRAADAVESTVVDGLDQAMNRFNG